ncbi:hypothetical protein AVEN_54599-1 [Araneus ventricosus]|uniref:Uncharacterized protein n=1 Tax=Araneus ventricosus TaxID=182803 RepID=A0A4Y2BML3_ARAVE|nr:hypothetical protein AVEN_54599-1 [Araneus ventricosus]
MDACMEFLVIVEVLCCEPGLHVWKQTSENCSEQGHDVWSRCTVDDQTAPIRIPPHSHSNSRAHGWFRMGAVWSSTMQYFHLFSHMNGNK